ncbi:MAG: ECF transporter S component [Lachnospiraceae bacterium]
MNKTKKLVTAALMAAFTCVATMIIKFPTPTLGYIHLGDGLVLLCGIILGPFTGALAAGIGSMFADLFAGYVIFAPGTFAIKAICALLAGLVFRQAKKLSSKHSTRYLGICIGGVLGELFMVTGYFLYEILLAVTASGTATTFSAAAAASATGIPFNLVQGATGIIIALILVPILIKIEDLRKWIMD